MKQLSTALILSISVICAPGASAQTSVKVGADGAVDVKTPGATVKAGEGGAVVRTPGATVKAGGGVAVVTAGAKAGAASGGTGPIECRGDETRTVSGVAISTDGDGVVARGNCGLTLNGVTIRAGGHGIVVRGNADVKINGSTVLGTAAAIALHGNSNATASGSTFKGRVVVKGNADFSKKAGRSPSSPSTVRQGGPLHVARVADPVAGGEDQGMIGGAAQGQLGLRGQRVAACVLDLERDDDGAIDEVGRR